MTPRVPVYFDAFLDAVKQGARIDHVHLGHWDQPHNAHDDFEAAQHRMAEILLALGSVQPGHHILDAGCGFGGLARLANADFSPISFTGLNIDPRQLAVCASITPRADNALHWVNADAVRFPFPGAIFDRIFCVEAIFHFASRRLFLEEAFRALKPDGILVLSDILLERPRVDIGVPAAAMEARLENELGPWPDKWVSIAELRSCAVDCGFAIGQEIHATENIKPSYETVAPAADTRATGPAVLRLLHESGHLSYVYLCLIKAAAEHR